MDWIVHAHIMRIERRLLGINESDDARIGSGRDDSDGGGTLSHFNPTASNSTDEKSSASLSSLFSTFVPVLIYSGICLALFLVFRRRCRRVYAPRTVPMLRGPGPPSPELPDGWVNWIRPFLAITDDYILNHCSLDGYFFLRYLRVLSIICVAGVVIIWPILLPVNGTGKSGLAELEALTIGNIKSGSRYYAHVLVAWCFFGFVLFMVCRECIYFINLRQAYLLSPNYAQRLSSRTVLFTCIPQPYLDEAKLRKLFGDAAKTIWLVQDTSALRALVDDREGTADRLQEAEVRLIRLANAARLKKLGMQATSVTLNTHADDASLPPNHTAHVDAEKGQVLESAIQFAQRQLSALDNPAAEKPADPEYTHPYGLDPSLPDVRGSVAALWIPAQSRPHYRPIGNFGRRVDTIRWTRARLKILNREIWNLRRKHHRGDGAPLNAVFIEFDSQASAQAAFQIVAHHQPLNMSPCYIGLQPDDVIWSALRIRWWEHIMRRFFMMCVIAAAIIFWSIPSVLVGMVTNIKSLSRMVFFLSWIMKLPGPILGVIQGLLPALGLSWLMAAVPWMLRGCARVAGVPSHTLVELYVQHAYFFFLVVQVFLVTTLTSAASASVVEVIQNPLGVKDMLSENLPKASNFYLSYILIQCLGSGATTLANVGDLIRHQVIFKAISNPRRRFYRWRRLRRVHWGSEFPRFTNLAVIAISYSCIAPLVLVFAGLGMLFVGFVYRYSLIYVYDSRYDTKGLFYPRALMQLMTGLYISQICLVGLFALKTAVGPMMLMIAFLIFTGIVHVSLNDAVTPLLYNLPRTLTLEKDKGHRAEDETPGQETSRPEPAAASTGLAADYYNMTSPDEDDFLGDSHRNTTHDLPTDVELRGIEGPNTLRYHLTQWTKALFRSAVRKAATPLKDEDVYGVSSESSFAQILRRIKIMITPDPSRPPNIITTFLHPEIYQSFRALQPRVNPEPGPESSSLPPDYARKAYWPPEMWIPVPRLWIPRDEARVSRQEVAHSAGSAVVSDRGCWLVFGKRKGRLGTIECDFEDPGCPLFEERPVY
ncbi:hypothetical protein VTJ83DRAFT_2813 [Remersonia thermophila]|uniref:DUF221-domain-containing protein n=1 Tax=Remersonia thermophila TaxID=72144 RepID=A0ABR4DM84_9PEZI